MLLIILRDRSNNNSSSSNLPLRRWAFRNLRWLLCLIPLPTHLLLNLPRLLRLSPKLRSLLHSRHMKILSLLTKDDSLMPVLHHLRPSSNIPLQAALTHLLTNTSLTTPHRRATKVTTCPTAPEELRKCTTPPPVCLPILKISQCRITRVTDNLLP